MVIVLSLYYLGNTIEPFPKNTENSENYSSGWISACEGSILLNLAYMEEDLSITPHAMCKIVMCYHHSLAYILCFCFLYHFK